eukprot:2107606-Rhodomonas_salina.1
MSMDDAVMNLDSESTFLNDLFGDGLDNDPVLGSESGVSGSNPVGGRGEFDVPDSPESLLWGGGGGVGGGGGMGMGSGMQQQVGMMPQNMQGQGPPQPDPSQGAPSRTSSGRPPSSRGQGGGGQRGGRGRGPSGENDGDDGGMMQQMQGHPQMDVSCPTKLSDCADMTALPAFRSLGEGNFSFILPALLRDVGSVFCLSARSFDASRACARQQGQMSSRQGSAGPGMGEWNSGCRRVLSHARH